VPNDEQQRRWNGESADRWLAQRDRHAAVRRPLLPHLWRTAAIAAGDQVLDVGCGCGDTTIAAARLAGPTGGATGVDLSAPLLDAARRSVTAAALTNVRLVRADAQVHVPPANGYDVTISSFGVMFFDDPVAAFTNLRDALRPGGRLAFLCWQRYLRNEVFAIPLRQFQRHGALPQGTDDDPFADPEQIRSILTRAGFTAVRVDELDEPVRLGDDVADVMAYIRATSQVRALLAGVRDPALAHRVLAGTEAAFAARQHPDGLWVRAAAYLVSAATPGPAGQSPL
jgi:SAM-dependent methyltransferase